ncbi:glycoside hydrolase family 19 protein [Streptomyces sp. H10-C2]|uniref:glycoside hydrolase family 19 protein n=1 Tax=unclassified Streptomyces TaxID=2593676 RepID=UPI0024B9DC0E|nr:MULTISPECIES: glycoside hydrolase family 19 protein [unclassified Streptomyces]MDJ0343471.1 glycoside hydrolase family 19 protein [Streptomyces sp. PH10-H1]MDJ0371551.1 glycoside hydrolase family 19 protein [Streptomyces sp. H10-C2]
MSRQRIMAFLTALIVAVGLAVLVPLASTASAAECASPWNASTVYTGGLSASYSGHNWSAKWWTQNETPGSAAVWADSGACGTSGPGTGGGSGSCDYPAWVAGRAYVTGDVVKYSDGNLYRAEHDNPGYDPVISTWYWEPYTCSGAPTTPPPSQGGFAVSEAQFNQMFPSRNSFYTYSGLTAALSAYPGFANTGSDTVKRQEAAAFLANVSHETGGLVYIVEQNTANYPHYCDASQSYGCPAGQSAYYGRGPIQLSWNFNYKAAGDALGIDLLHNPSLVETDASVAWKTGLWYWNTQNGPGTMTPHNAMVNSAGFGETIRSINGSIECNGGNPAQVQSRIDAYQRFVQILGVPAGNNLSC